MSETILARYECEWYRIDHTSQKYHDLCLWTSPQEWIQDYKYQEPVLECLNIYSFMEGWDVTICDYLMEPKARETKAIHLPAAEETEESYKSWQYLKKSQRYLTEQWKNFLGQETGRIIYRRWIKKQNNEEQTKSEDKRTIPQNEKKFDWLEPSPLPVYEIWNGYHTTLLNNIPWKEKFVTKTNCQKGNLWTRKPTSQIRTYKKIQENTV